MESLVAFRHELHAHPELAHRERATAQRIVDALDDLHPTMIRTGVGGTGVVATFDSGQPGPILLFRAELDALPITELDVEHHRSTNLGVSHKCGHDGHAAIVVGLAQRLATDPIERGAVHLLFQPAEETGTGAAAMLADPAFDDITPDVAYAVHNMPGFPLHAVVVRPGPITAAVRSIVLRFEGRTAHASEPHLGENPSQAIADLLTSTAELNVPQLTDPGFRLVTPVHIIVGSPAYGVSAGDGELHLTIRAADNSSLAALEHEIVELATRFTQRDQLRLTREVVENFAANVNDPGATNAMRAAAVRCGLTVIEPDAPMPAGEDFGLFGERFPTCMALLGAGVDHLPIHNPSYDFPDELLATGVALFDQIVTDALRR